MQLVLAMLLEYQSAIAEVEVADLFEEAEEVIVLSPPAKALLLQTLCLEILILLEQLSKMLQELFNHLKDLQERLPTALLCFGWTQLSIISEVQASLKSCLLEFQLALQALRLMLAEPLHFMSVATQLLELAILKVRPCCSCANPCSFHLRVSADPIPLLEQQSLVTQEALSLIFARFLSSSEQLLFSHRLVCWQHQAYRWLDQVQVELVGSYPRSLSPRNRSQLAS